MIMKLPLNLPIKSSKLHNLTLFEPVDLVTLNKLINSTLLKDTFHNEIVGKYYENEKQQILEYKKLISKSKYAKVKYAKTQNMKYGRCNPQRALGLYNIRREIRHTLAKNTMEDIDIENCHPVLLYQLLKSNGLKDICGSLEQYISRRDDYLKMVMEHYNVKRDPAKKLFIQLLYGGGINSWRDFNEIPDTTKDIDFVLKFKTEFATLCNIIVNHNPLIVKEVKARKDEQNKKDYNLNSSVCSYYLQEWECRILEECYLYAVDNGYINNKVAVLCADGLMIEKKNYNPAILTELSNLIKTKFGFELNFTNKNMDMDYLEILDANLKPTEEWVENNSENNDDKKDIQDNDKNVYPINAVINNDNEAIILLYDFLKTKLIYCNRVLYMKKEGTHYWERDRVNIDAEVIKFIMSCKILKNMGMINVIYSQQITTAKQLREGLYIHLTTNPTDLYDKFHNTTKNRLCFEDGILDFLQRKFYKWEDVDFEYYSPIMIRRSYYKYFINPNRDVINQVKESIYSNLYGKDIERGIHFLCRAITGNTRDKRFGTFMGNRDCGKGVLYEHNKATFGDYVRTFELSNILIHRSSNKVDEASRKNYWKLDLEYARLAISQETPTPESGLKANGKEIKGMASGGDTQVARRNYDREDTHFVLDCTFMIMGNDELEVDVADTNEHRVRFNSVNQYKSAADIDKMREQGKRSY